MRATNRLLGRYMSRAYLARPVTFAMPSRREVSSLIEAPLFWRRLVVAAVVGSKVLGMVWPSLPGPRAGCESTMGDCPDASSTALKMFEYVPHRQMLPDR